MSKIKITKGSGNVFADIGIPDADVHKVKADLVFQLTKRIEQAGLTEAEAAKRLGVSPTDISQLLKGHFSSYSVARILFMFTELGLDVRIEISAAKNTKKTGSLTVTA